MSFGGSKSQFNNSSPCWVWRHIRLRARNVVWWCSTWNLDTLHVSPWALGGLSVPTASWVYSVYPLLEHRGFLGLSSSAVFLVSLVWSPEHLTRIVLLNIAFVESLRLIGGMSSCSIRSNTFTWNALMSACRPDVEEMEEWNGDFAFKSPEEVSANDSNKLCDWMRTKIRDEIQRLFMLQAKKIKHI